MEKHAPKRTNERTNGRDRGSDEKKQDKLTDRERALSLSLSLFTARKSVSVKSVLTEQNHFQRLLVGHTVSGGEGTVLNVIKTIDSPTNISRPITRTFVSAYNCPVHCVATCCVYAMYLNMLAGDLSIHVIETVNG